MSRKKAAAQNPASGEIRDLPPDSAETIFVYFCSGVIEPIRPATSVQALPDEIVVRNGDQAVASFPRSQVFFCSRVQTPPFQT